MPGAIESDGRGAPAHRQDDPVQSAARLRASAALRRRWERFGATRSRAWLALTTTVAAWAASAVLWVQSCVHLDRTDSALGWDMTTVWRAERVFARGGQPYSLAATDHRLFLYPPSCLLLLRPVAFVSLHVAQVGGLVLTAVMIWAAVMLSAHLLGRPWWGLSAAIVVLALHWAEPATAELQLENVTVLCCVALAIFFLLGAREHWITAGVVIGLSLSIKPLFLSVLLVFVLTRKWRALAAAVAVPAVLNGLAFAVVKDPTQVFSKLPSLLSRSGSGALLNSAWVDVFRTFAFPHWATILVRLATVAVALIAAWWSWRLLEDARVRLVTTSSVLLIGAYLGGTLSENHYMLTLIPLAMSAVLPLSPMRQVTAWIGTLLFMGLTPPASMLGIDTGANLSAYRAFGMSLVLLTIVGVLGARWYRRRAPSGVTSPEVEGAIGEPGPGTHRPATAEAALTR